MSTRLSVHRQGEKVSVRDKISASCGQWRFVGARGSGFSWVTVFVHWYQLKVWSGDQAALIKLTCTDCGLQVWEKCVNEGKEAPFVQTCHSGLAQKQYKIKWQENQYFRGKICTTEENKKTLSHSWKKTVFWLILLKKICILSNSKGKKSVYILIKPVWVAGLFVGMSIHGSQFRFGTDDCSLACVYFTDLLLGTSLPLAFIMCMHGRGIKRCFIDLVCYKILVIMKLKPWTVNFFISEVFVFVFLNGQQLSSGSH